MELELAVGALHGNMEGGQVDLAMNPGDLDGVGISDPDFYTMISMLSVMLLAGYLAGKSIIISWNHTRPSGKPKANGSDGGSGEFVFEPQRETDAPGLER